MNRLRRHPCTRVRSRSLELSNSCATEGRSSFPPEEHVEVAGETKEPVSGPLFHVDDGSGPQVDRVRADREAAGAGGYDVDLVEVVGERLVAATGEREQVDAERHRGDLQERVPDVGSGLASGNDLRELKGEARGVGPAGRPGGKDHDDVEIFGDAVEAMAGVGPDERRGPCRQGIVDAVDVDRRPPADHVVHLIFPVRGLAIAGARREALAAFGDDVVYLEKMINEARHIEIQLLADIHGNVIYLGERECSLQRRHQKLIEEAPSFVVDEPLRRRMGEVAVAAARAVDYVNAGTIEFLVDRDKNFYFLEMNTRLQVEHPVTELVTGVDIVQEQFRIARGRRLRVAQEDIQIKGWAIECRINAEDPYQNYLPSTGQITTSRLPTGPGVRVDTGVFPGYEITPYYDSMISKLICYGETRGEAVLRMRRALEEYRVMGVKTNIPFHQHMMDSHRFLTGQFDTKFVEERFSMSDREAPDVMEAAILAALVAHRQGQQASQIVAPGERDTSNWKWYSRWERLRR